MQYMLTPYAKAIEPFATWEGAFTTQELNWLQQQAKSAKENAFVGSGDSGSINTDIRRSQLKWLSNTPETNWIFEKLADVCLRLNMEYFRFDLTGFGENLQLTNYDQSENGMYGWHLDYGNVISRKISMVVQLSDDSEYEGGNLQIMTNGEPKTVSKQRGLIAVFPSYTLHQVTPVTSGNRQSLVAWVSGPAFK
jgi:predicted 2-oxoglutarate/Fe(II)-dependent dioxygenase YbiX